jgi:anti-sigma regulatory factor (Ser/Thr protein kinase)
MVDLRGHTSILKIPVERGDFSRAGEASSRIKSRLTQLGYSPRFIRKAAIAAYEAEINIVIHSLGGQMEAAVKKDSVLIIASDAGPGIDNIEKAMREGYSTASPAAQQMGFGAGMGLPNMKNCCDDFHIQSAANEGTVVRMLIKS